MAGLPPAANPAQGVRERVNFLFRRTSTLEQERLYVAAPANDISHRC